MRHRYHHTPKQIRKHGSEIKKRISEHSHETNNKLPKISRYFFDCLMFLFFITIFCLNIANSDLFNSIITLILKLLFFPLILLFVYCIILSYNRFRLAPMLLTIVMILVGVGLISIGIQNIKTAIESSSWPMANGKVEMSRLSNKLVPLGAPVTGYITRLKIVYKYSVVGKEFFGNRVSFDAIRPASGYDYKYSNKYPKYSEVNAYYNPVRPRQSVLEPGLRLRVFEELLFGFEAFCIGILSLYPTFRSFESQKNN
jgi:hypothetical protein